MAYSWKILRSAVEQEILFPSEKCYNEYVEQLIEKKEPFQIVDDEMNEDGTMTVVMRKRYNNTQFFQTDVDIPDEKIKEMIIREISAEAKALEEKVESDPSLDDLEMPSGSFEELMARIHKKELE